MRRHLLAALLALPACARPPAAAAPAAPAAAASPALAADEPAPAADVPPPAADVPPPATPSTPPDVAAPPLDAIRTPSGLAYKVLQPGTGTQHPTAADTVRVHYSGWTTDGHLFDSSVQRGEPASFPVAAVIKGWGEGVQLMVVGEKMRFWIPAALAYGDAPKGDAPRGMLVFDVELLAIE